MLVDDVVVGMISENTEFANSDTETVIVRRVLTGIVFTERTAELTTVIVVV